MPSGNIPLRVNTEAKPSAARSRSDHLRPWLPLIFGATAYLTLITRISSLLRDADIYWHIVVGQWIIDHRAVPHVDPFSFTMRDAPWVTSEWLSEVLYFAAFKVAGWPGPALLAALSVSTAFFLLTHLLLKRLQNVPVMILVTGGLVLTSFHMLARPHVLVFPLMVLWANALVEASEQRHAPSLAYLPLIALWANLHGSFTLALALIAPFALEAIWAADKLERRAIALRWIRFGALALVAACITPYGPESILVTVRILNLGAVLSTIGEWRPALEFGAISPITICFFAGMAYVLYTGLKLPPIRVAALLAVVYQTFVHVRYVDVCALVAPFFIAGPLAQHLASPQWANRKVVPASRTAVFAALAGLMIATGVIVATKDHAPPNAPRIAIEKLRQLNASRILNDYYFGGYLISEGIPTFIDSRAELYGPVFLSRYVRAVSLEDLADLVRLLDEYKIDATLLFPVTPAVALLDRMPEWQRIYADDTAVVHIRRTDAKGGDSRR